MLLSERLAIPESNYGYWITDRGEFLTVDGPNGHKVIAEKYQDGYYAALGSGWIRVVTRFNKLDINLYKNKVTNRAISSLRSLVNSQYFETYIIEIGPIKDSEWFKFDDAGSFLRKANQAKKQQLHELYQEQEGSTFTHDGKKYDLNLLLQHLDGTDTYDVPLDALDWVLEWDEADPERLRKADLSAPIIVTWWLDDKTDEHRLVVIDGLHRVKKALDQGAEYLPAHYVDNDDLVTCLIKSEITERAETPKFRDPRSNQNFVKWFGNSKVVNEDGSPKVMFHGTSQNFKAFDPQKIKANETDAPFNGFWFSSSPETGPAFHAPTNIMAVYLSIKNPASWRIWRKVSKQVYSQNEVPARSRSFQDEVRHQLMDMGYDGILFEGKPEIDHDEFHKNKRYDFRTARGNKHWITKDTVPEHQWGTKKATREEVVGELIKTDGSRSKITIDIRGLAILIADEADFSNFDFNTHTGTIKLPNGNVIEAKIVEHEYEYEGPIPTGKDIEEVNYYSDNIGHLTGYNDLEDFLQAHSEEIWVCFHPTQIKSVMNKGTWNSQNPIITEGVIKVPDDMLNAAMTFYRKEILHWARDQLKGRSREYMNSARELRELTRQYFPDGLPNYSYGNTDKTPVRVEAIHVPSHYDKLSPSKSTIYVAIDWRPSEKNLGVWFKSKSCVIIYPMANRWMRSYPSHNLIDTVNAVLEQIKNTVTHELRHAIQELFFASIDSEQVKMKNNYRNSKADYYTSPIEFDPTIGSCAAQFVDLAKMAGIMNKPSRFKKAIKQYTAMAPSMVFDTFNADEFFKILKKEAPKKYVMAVKKFFLEVEHLRDNLVETQLLEIEQAGELYDPDEWEKVSSSSFDENRFRTVGTLEKYTIVTPKTDELFFKFDNGYHTNGTSYLLFADNKPVAYIHLIDHYHDLYCKKVAGIRIADSERGNNLGPKIYKWLVTKGGIDCLFSDDNQTSAGTSIWKRLLDMDGVVVMARDYVTGEEYPVSTVKQLAGLYSYDSTEEMYLTKRFAD